MKKSFLIIFSLLLTCLTYAQQFYSKITTPDTHQSSYSLGNLINKNDTLIFNTFPVEELSGKFYTSTYLNKYTKDGKLVNLTKLGAQSKFSKVLMDNEKIYVLGTFKESTMDSVQILLVEGDKVIQKLEFYNPYSYQGLGAHFQFLKFNDKFVILCSGLYFLKQLDFEHKPYIIWVNNDFTIDSVMQVDLPYGELFDSGIDDNGHLNIFAQYHSDRQIAGPNMTKNYQGYIKLDESKEIIHSYFEEQKDWRFPYTKRPNGVIYNDGTKIFTYTRGRGIGEIKISALNKNDVTIWTDSTYHDQKVANNVHRSFTKCQNNDVLVLAENFHQSLLSSQGNNLITSVIQRLDKSGKEKFYRSYGYYTNNESETAGNWLYDIKEIDPNNIIAIGGVRKSPQDKHAIYPNQLLNDSTWILSVDSMGCIEKDKCNDVIAWNAPHNLYQYDQINVRHKEWYFSNATGRYSQSFGRDTNMFDNKSNWIRYRPIITRILNTGVEKKDTVLATWTREGRMYISGIKKCFDCSGTIYPLYDFTLSLHDTFTLPYGYGKAVVTQVDSISLVPGYLRKRIILQHLNQPNQTKYGDLIWIEGIGSPNGILYYNDWQQGTKTELTCYYDRGEKRYSSTDDPDCRKPILIKPEFEKYGPYCIGSEADILPQISINSMAVYGKWSPESIITSVVGSFRYIFTPHEDQNADTTSILVQVVYIILPEFQINKSYSLNGTPELLPSTSFNGIQGSWSPPIIDTKSVGSTTYTFTPNETSCAMTLTIDINVSSTTDTTDMDQSTTWYTSSYSGGITADRDCELQIDFTKVVRDTVIGDRLARVIGVYRGGTYIPESEIVLFSKSGKMYFHEDNTWKLLYDFTANVGDTVSYHISRKYPYFDRLYIPCCYEQYIIDQNPFQLVIEKIDTVFTISGEPLKRFLTKNNYNMDSHSMGRIVENVGSVAKLFGSNGNIKPPECHKNFPSFRCYSDDDISINFINEECDKLVSATDLKLSGITIYPNPGVTQLNIKKDNDKDFLFTITNLAGQILRSGQVDNHLEISTVEWTSGMYFINITDSHGNRFVQKWVKM